MRASEQTRGEEGNIELSTSTSVYQPTSRKKPGAAKSNRSQINWADGSAFFVKELPANLSVSSGAINLTSSHFLGT